MKRATGLARVWFWAAPLCLAGPLALTACTQSGVSAPAAADTVAVALPAHLGYGEARLLLYRITSARSGERLGVGRRFHLEPDRQVRAVLQLDGLYPDQQLLLHLMWINPDGKEVYTKEVRIESEEWRDAEARAARAAALVTLAPERSMLEIESRYGVDPIRLEEELHRAEEQRAFKLGTWRVRAYLFRQLILEMPFELLPEE